MATTQQVKKTCRQYSVEYLKYGFVTAPHSEQQPMCLLCKKHFRTKPSRLLEDLKKRTQKKQANT